MIHPIEAESYQILGGRVDLSHLSPGARAVIARVIHATADLEYAQTMVVPESAVQAAVAAVAGGCPVVCDVKMTDAGIAGVDTLCYLSEATGGDGVTRSAAGIRLAAAQHPHGALMVIGCAPTALMEALRLAEQGVFHPAALIALPVGFVGAAAAKEAARQSNVAVISNTGDKGGSAAAAAACNAIIRLAHG